MFVSRILLWNFRKFGAATAFDLSQPHLDLRLKSGLNLLIGENDSGKTAIIDALKIVLQTHALYWIKVEQDTQLSANARNRLEITYLRALRDVVNELFSRRNSHLSQIRYSHSAFKGQQAPHRLMTLSQQFDMDCQNLPPSYI